MMAGKSDNHDANHGSAQKKTVRADALRNVEALLESAKAVFAVSGVDAPVREIAEKAGVGLGTVYRHFPQRSDLVAAVMRYEVDACAAAVASLASAHPPGEALTKWLYCYADLVTTKRGLAPALHCGDPAYESLRAYFEATIVPAFQKLLAAAVAEGTVRDDVIADDILNAVGSVCISAYSGSAEQTRRMVTLLIDGLKYGARH